MTLSSQKLHLPASLLDRTSTTHPELVVPILSSGLLAHQFCQDVAFAKVEAVFDRCFYVRAGDDFICIGDRRIGNSPIMLTGNDFWVPSLGLSAGQLALIDWHSIAIGSSVRFTLDRSELWHPADWPACPSPDRLSDIFRIFRSRAAISAPQESLARCITGGGGISELPLGRIARSRVAKFERWLADLFEGTHAPAAGDCEAAQGLIGLGPGLTPSGDDFLIGALAALDVLGEVGARPALARVILDMQPSLTTPLSACFLRAAAAGHIGENLHTIISLLITGNVDAAIARAAKIGHSSGWDMMAGVVATLRFATASSRLV